MSFKPNIRENTLLIFLLSVFPINVVMSQTLTSYTTPTLGIGARAAALADAYTADTHDVSSIYWNPAAVVFLQESSVLLNHRDDQVYNTLNEDVVTPFRRGNNGIAFGASVSHLGYWKDSPQGPAFRFIQYDLNMDYARAFGPHLSLGVSINGGYGKTQSSHLWVTSASFGLLYSPYSGISYGIAYKGVGWRIRYSFDSTSTTLLRENQVRTLQMGVTMKFPRSPFKPPLLTLTAVNEKNFRENGVGYKAGIEIFPVQFLGLRIGYHVNNTSAAARYGAGLRLNGLQLDYAISPSHQDERFQEVSLLVPLWK
jgi:hypothetical protein